MARAASAAECVVVGLVAATRFCERPEVSTLGVEAPTVGPVGAPLVACVILACGR